ncbi:MAG: hypothetical protein ACOYIG_11250 [Acetivibrionales bacterium]
MKGKSLLEQWDEALYAQSESDKLVRQLERAERERDSLKLQLAEANATCAAMRQVLELAEAWAKNDCASCESPFKEDDTCQFPNLCTTRPTLAIIQKALSLDAGKDLLERLRKAEELLEYLRGRAEVVIENDKTCYDHHEPRPDGKNPREDGGTCWLTPKEIAKYMLLDIDAFLKGGGKDA